MKHAETRILGSEAPPPGSLRVVEVGGYTVGLFNVDGRFFALADRCPHRGAPLCSRGEVVGAVVPIGDRLHLQAEGEFIRCPWHKWDFEIATGKAPAAPWLQVRRYKVRIEGDAIVVSLESARGDEPSAKS